MSALDLEEPSRAEKFWMSATRRGMREEEHGRKKEILYALGVQ
jgi:hypothetical protein